MKNEQILQFAVCAGIAFLCAAEPAWGQATRPAQKSGTGGAGGANAGEVRILRFPAAGKTAMVRTPEFSVNVNNIQPRVAKRQREWALFEVRYVTSAKWTDELKFDYHVMTKGKSEDGKGDAYSYFTASVRYVDIPEGDHMSCVALPPSLVERYGEPIVLTLEIVGKDGTVLASKTEVGKGMNLGGKESSWWRESSIMDSRDDAGNPRIARRNGLLERSKTPFALINLDDYEVVQ